MLFKMNKILTSSGSYFDFNDIQSNKVCIYEIAHALSNICRFTGHTKSFYSVAQHSVLVSYIVPPEFALAGLLHDAAEAYIGDVSKPLKTLLPDYAIIEKQVEKLVFSAFNLGNKPYHEKVKKADLIMLLTEQRDLMIESKPWEFEGISPLPNKITAFNNKNANKLFLDRFFELTLNIKNG